MTDERSTEKGSETDDSDVQPNEGGVSTDDSNGSGSTPDSLAALEETYQEHRVLRTETPVTARISDIGVGDRIYIELAISETNRWVVGLAKSLRGVRALFEFHRVVDVDIQFGTDLGKLVDETVSLRFPNDDMSVVSLGQGGQVTEPISPAGRVMVPEKRSIPEGVATCARRLDRYHSTGAPAVRTNIIGAEPESGVLVIELQLLGEPARLEVPIPGQAQMAGSRFETIVETVGHGSVRQVQGGALYTVRERTLPRPATETPMALGVVQNWVVTWVLFSSESRAREALALPGPQAPSRPAPRPEPPRSNRHDVSREEVNPFDPVLHPDEVVKHVGIGGPIEIARAGGTESVASISGFERIAVTDRRVLMQSSQLTGDEFFQFDYDEIQTVDFGSDTVDRWVSVHTDYGRYRITLSQPGEQTCKRMVGFIESNIYADR